MISIEECARAAYEAHPLKELHADWPAGQPGAAWRDVPWDRAPEWRRAMLRKQAAAVLEAIKKAEERRNADPA